MLAGREDGDVFKVLPPGFGELAGLSGMHPRVWNGERQDRQAPGTRPRRAPTGHAETLYTSGGTGGGGPRSFEPEGLVHGGGN